MTKPLRQKNNLRSMTTLLCSCSLLLTIAGLICSNANAQDSAAVETMPPKGVGLEIAFPKLRFERPVFLTHAGDQRIFVVEQEGVIRVFDNSEEASSCSIFLDISDRVSRAGNEEGLLGLAFHPNFLTNGEFYVHYSSSKKDMHGIVSRFRVDQHNWTAGNPDSEEVILEIKQPFRNHNGGSVVFGPDKHLYLSLGDGGKANDPLGSGQDLNSLLGKILRIDVDKKDGELPYGIPKDNPFIDREDARPEIYALGLRNVWRFSFDRKTGDLWAGDVGQNLFDEVSLITKGGNYGWNRWEADAPFDESTKMATDTHIPPVTNYGRQWGLSITGGNVYRGKKYPQLAGAYFYGDYVTGNLWQLTKKEDGEYDNKLVRRTGRSIASFGEDREGEVYLMSFDGRIYRIVPTAEPENFLADWPKKISETEIFSDLRKKTVSEKYAPYDVNAPFWSDGASKRRFIRLPEGTSMNFHDTEAWSVPIGTEIVKNFRAPNPKRMLETRVIKRTDTGWEAATYVWNRRNTEAILYPEGRQFEHFVQAKDTKKWAIEIWHGPSSSECASCHTDASGYVLGLRTAQLNDVDGEENQIKKFIRRGWLSDVPADFSPVTAVRFCNPHDKSGDLNDRARVLLDVNCAMCHRPNGPGNANIDLRFATSDEQTKIFDTAPAQGDLGIVGGKIIAKKDPDKSLLLERMKTLSAGRMPTIGSNAVDHQAIELIRKWIESKE